MKTLLSLIAVVLTGSMLHAADWPAYRGVNQGISEEAIRTDWENNPPKLLWKIPARTGFSSFCVADGKLFTQEVVDGREVCVALNADTGEELWTSDVAIGEGYHSGGEGDGPRSTPAYSDGMVFVLTPDLVLHGLDATDGKSLWKCDLVAEYGAQNIAWNSAASPVVDGDLVFVMGGHEGQSLLAFQKKTGELAWKAETEMMTHATPVVAEIKGIRQIIFYCQSGLVSLEAETGKLLWRFPVQYRTSTAASPVVDGDIVYASAGYGVGGAACKVGCEGEEWNAEELWRTPGKDLANHWSTPVCVDGHLYGMYGFKEYYPDGHLKCVELATGKVCWEQIGFGQGNIVAAGGKLLALAENGELVLVESTPEGYKELGRIQAVDGKCWSTPAVANGRVYIRSVKEAACWDVSP